MDRRTTNPIFLEQDVSQAVRREGRAPQSLASISRGRWDPTLNSAPGRGFFQGGQSGASGRDRKFLSRTKVRGSSGPAWPKPTGGNWMRHWLPRTPKAGRQLPRTTLPRPRPHPSVAGPIRSTLTPRDADRKPEQSRPLADSGALQRARRTSGIQNQRLAKHSARQPAPPAPLPLVTVCY